jgi:RNA-binding protein NOB1
MASSWAAVATRKAPAAPAAPALADLTGVSVLVVDANALINGVRLEGVAERVVTTAEVLDEIRDAKTRAFVASLPYEIHVMEPSEESCKAGEFVCRDALSSGADATRGIDDTSKGGAPRLSHARPPRHARSPNPPHTHTQSSTLRAPRAKSPPSAPSTSA